MNQRRADIVLFGLALAVLVYSPILNSWGNSGFGDWKWFHHSWEVAYVAIHRWHELPVWDPHHCGGVPAWGQPQSQHLAPTYWLTGLLFGTVRGSKLFILLHHLIGYAGMYVLCRRFFAMRNVAAALAAITFTFNGYFAWRAGGGHSTFLAFHYLPWIFYCWRRANDDVRYAGGVAALMGMVLVEGGTYPFPLTCVFLGWDFFTQLVQGPTRLRVLRTATISGALTLVVGAIRLWPIYEVMSRYPRETRMEDSQQLTDLLESFAARDPHPWQWGHRWVWPEYSAYLGYGVLGLAALGALLILLRHRRWWGWVGGALLFAAISMGNRGPHWPWPLIHELPVYGNLHVPSRFHVILAFYLTLLAGFAVHRITNRVTSWTARRWLKRGMVAFAWFIVLAVCTDVLSNTVVVNTNKWEGMDIYGAEEDHFHLVSGPTYMQSYFHYPHRNLGTPDCYDPVPWNISRRLWVGDVPQARIEPPTAGEVTHESRTPSTTVTEVTLREGARVLFNQNYDPDWHLSVGPGVDQGGLLAVDVGPGTHRIEGRYHPPDLPYSPLVTLGGLLACLGLGLPRWIARRRRRRALAA
ncbi:MAG: hypothetical protein AB7S26_01370 [Sandaracinaceae bacterium]